MQLIINHKPRLFEADLPTLATLIATETQGKTSGIAVAVNNQVIPQAHWAATVLNADDHILIITATQGG